MAKKSPTKTKLATAKNASAASFSALKVQMQVGEIYLTYISNIVADLQDYARPLKPNVQTIEISKIVTDVFSATYVPEPISLQPGIENLE